MLSCVAAGARSCLITKRMAAERWSSFSGLDSAVLWGYILGTSRGRKRSKDAVMGRNKRVFPALVSVMLALILPSSHAYGDRVIAEEAKIFQELRSGVFTVFGDQGHGSGFLIDGSGLIMTNQHVVARSSHISVLITDSLKVKGRLVAEDEHSDLAIVVVDPKFIQDLPILTLRRNPDDLAMEGERVIAIGSPLNQTRILTSGIVSKVDKRAIISDVNINHGNSGGPLINMDREVIAVNTFADFPRSGGPGISGSIRIELAYDIVERAMAAVADEPATDTTKLPVMPKDIYPLWALKKAALDEKFNDDVYHFSAGNYEITVQTPPFSYWLDKQYELRLSEKRARREREGSATETDTFDPFKDLKTWYQYVGEYSPVIAIVVKPKVGQTSGSSWANALGAFAAGLSGTSYCGVYEYEFKGDLQDFSLMVDRNVRNEIQRGMVFIPLNIQYWGYYGATTGEDLARAGVFTFSHDFFERSASEWPLVHGAITSIDKPDQRLQFRMPAELVEAIWVDFEPYREYLAGKDIPLSVNRSPTKGDK